LDPDFLASEFYRKDFGALLFAATRTVFQAYVPAVPAAYYLAILNNAFAEREPQMGTKIFNRVNPAIPLKQGNPNAISFYGESESVGHQFIHICNPYP